MKNHLRILGLGLVLLSVALIGLLPTIAFAEEATGPTFEFFGVVQQLPSAPGYVGDWKVNNLTVHVTTTTVVDTRGGTIEVGKLVHVVGRLLLNGSVNAIKIELIPHANEVEFFGIIQQLPSAPGFVGDWKVNNLVVHVASTTVITPTGVTPVVGAYVRVRGVPQTDGSINATHITVLANGDLLVKFAGTVIELPQSGLVGDWKVSVPVSQNLPSQMGIGPGNPPTRTVVVHVSSATRVDETRGQVLIGTLVKIEGTVRADRSVDAGAIEVLSPPSPGRTEFPGRIESLPSGGTLIGDWVVSGRTVHVSALTQIDQSRTLAQVGAFVMVKGILLADRSVNATEIEVRAAPPPPPVRYIKFYGTVQQVPASGLVGDYKISGLTVHVTAQTIIRPTPADLKKDAIVEVKGILQIDGSITAVQIEVRRMAQTESPFGSTNSLFGNTSAIGQVDH